VGLAYDFCVRFSAQDAAKCGFQSVVVTDACRSVGLPGSVQAADEGMAAAGVAVVESSKISALVAAAAS
jgi:nicotinamidase/pyrazinamidase